MKITLVRYCDLCGRRRRITLDEINQLRAEKKRLLCHVCTSKINLGWYSDQTAYTD